MTFREALDSVCMTWILEDTVFETSDLMDEEISDHMVDEIYCHTNGYEMGFLNMDNFVQLVEESYNREYPNRISVF